MTIVIVMAYVVMAYVVVAPTNGLQVVLELRYSYSLYSYGLCSYGPHQWSAGRPRTAL